MKTRIWIALGILAAVGSAYASEFEAQPSPQPFVPGESPIDPEFLAGAEVFKRVQEMKLPEKLPPELEIIEKVTGSGISPWIEKDPENPNGQTFFGLQLEIRF